MQLATYNTLEFFYDTSFEDYGNFCGIPHLLKETRAYSSLARDLAKLDNGDGVFFNDYTIQKYLPNLNKYDEFKDCKIHYIDSPVFNVAYYIDRQHLTMENLTTNVENYYTEFDPNFKGEKFAFSGIFYLYSIQFFSDNYQYYLNIRGYEKV